MLCHPHVVVDGQDVSDGAAVDVLEVVIASFGKDQSVALLLKKDEERRTNERVEIISCLIKDSGKAVRVLSPGNIPVVVCPISQNHLGEAFVGMKKTKSTSSISSESVLKGCWSWQVKKLP